MKWKSGRVSHHRQLWVYKCFNSKVCPVRQGGEEVQIFVRDEADNVWQMINWEVCPKILKREKEASDESPDVFSVSFPSVCLLLRL